MGGWLGEWVGWLLWSEAAHSATAANAAVELCTPHLGTIRLLPLQAAGMTDALLKAAEQLPLEAFLQLPLEGSGLALQQQAVLLAKLRAMSDEWGGRRFCLRCGGPAAGMRAGLGQRQCLGMCACACHQ